MIRFEIALRWALLGGLIGPALAEGQDPRPADPAEPSREARRDPQPRPAPPGPNFTINEEIFTSLAGQDPGGYASTFSQSALQMMRGMAGSFDPLESNFGLTLSPIDDVLRGQLEIPAGQGVLVAAVRPASLAEQAGLKPNDILLNLGEQRVLGVNQARGILLALGKEAVEVKLIREGKPSRMSLVGPEHGFPPESAEYWIGVPVSPVDPSLRSHLPALPADAGLVANDVVKGSPADGAGVRKGDILVSMGGKPLKDADSLIQQVQATGGKPVALVVLRAGKTTTIEVQPARRAHPTVIGLPNRPMTRFRIVRPQEGVVVRPDGVRGIEENLKFYRPGAPNPPDKPIDLQFEVFTGRARSSIDEANARIEAQLKALSEKLDEVRKALDGAKKPEAK